MQEITLYLLSGFLGAGKTTLLQRMLSNYAQRRVGVLVNEFGQLGIDGRLIESGDIRMTEIDNGSIFCSCLKAQFVDALIRFSESPVELLLVESSGLADPTDMQRILTDIEKRLARPYRYAGSICLVDCTTFLEYADVLLPIEHQIAAADVILLNKTDIAQAAVIDEVEARVKEINPSARVLRTTYAQVPFDELPISGMMEKSDRRCCCNFSWNRPDSYVLRTSCVVLQERLLDAAVALSPHVLRMKGFAQCENGSVFVEIAGGRASVRQVRADKDVSGTELILLTDKPNSAAALLDIWEKAAGCAAHIE
jgi:G3E family GTPase